jgi:hypothetical protein
MMNKRLNGLIHRIAKKERLVTEIDFYIHGISKDRVCSFKRFKRLKVLKLTDTISQGDLKTFEPLNL